MTRNRFIAAMLLLLSTTAHAQNTTTPQTGLGASCKKDQFSYGGFLFVCGSDNRFRYALPEDVPASPPEGYLARPSWYPAISEIFRGTDPPRCPLSGRVTFTSPIVPLADLLTTVPQGEMIGDHVTPIDHGYIGIRPLAKRTADRTEADFVPVTAPADGEVIEVSLLGSPTSIRVVFAHGCDTYSVFMVLNRLSGALAYLQDDLMKRQFLTPHVRLLAGEQFAEQRDNPIDFSVHDGATWLSGFVAPFSYAEGEAWKPFTVDPWPYFAPDLQQAYEATLQRVFPPRWGRIDHDVPGTAAGNWFLAGTVGYSGKPVEAFRSATTPLTGGAVDGKKIYSWSHLAFARHCVQPTQWIFSTGWWKDERGDGTQWLLDIAPSQPEPSQLTPESGVVVYRLRGWAIDAPRTDDASMAPRPIDYHLIPTMVMGLVAVQVNADSTLTIEVMPGTQEPSAFTGFTQAKRTYRR